MYYQSKNLKYKKEVILKKKCLPYNQLLLHETIVSHVYQYQQQVLRIERGFNQKENFINIHTDTIALVENQDIQYSSAMIYKILLLLLIVLYIKPILQYRQ